MVNDGINIEAARGADVRAAENGVVAFAGNQGEKLGNVVLVRHADGWMTVYTSLDDLKVKAGETVRRGQVVATVGQTLDNPTPQLHFQVRRQSRALNPLDHLDVERRAAN